MIDPNLIAEGRALFELTVMPEQPVNAYNANDDGFDVRPQWCIANDAIDGGDGEDEVAINLIVDVGTRADTEWIAWLINNGEQLLDELEGLHVQLGRLKQSVESDYVAIAAKHDRDRARIARALKVIDQHAGYDLAGKVRAILEGNDE